MPWLKFTDRFDFDVPRYNGRVTIAYKANTTMLVTRACADAAVAAGKAKRVRNPAAETTTCPPEQEASESV